MTDIPADPLHHQSPGGDHFVSIVQCANGALSTGSTTDVDTRAHRPVVLLACWPFTEKSEALRAEWASKRLARAKTGADGTGPSLTPLRPSG